MRSIYSVLYIAVTFAATPSPAVGQERPAPVVDVSAGWAGFPDDSAVYHHRTVGAAARFYLTPRFSIGPEVTYMVGPGTDRDLFVVGNAIYEWPMLVRGRSPRLVPYVIVGWGYFRHRSRFGSFISHTSAFAGGTGMRMRITDRILAGPELRLGSQFEMRLGGTVTLRMGQL